jgi:hypothetical protein
MMCCCVQAETMGGSSVREIQLIVQRLAMLGLTMNRNNPERLSSERGRQHDKDTIHWAYPETA